MVELTRVAHGLWRPVHEVDDLSGQCASLLRAMPAGAVVAGRAAAELHGLWLPNRSDHRIEIVVRGDPRLPREIGHSRRPQLRARRRTLRDDEVVEVDGVPVTSPTRTWCDLAEWLRPADLVACGDSVLHMTAVDELASALARAAGRRGVRRARVLLPMLDARSASRPESHLRYAIVSAGLPEPAVNVAVYAGGDWLGIPDLHYKRARLALEYDGRDHADPDRMRRDITRRLDFDSAGWKVLTFGPRQVFGRPDQVVARVRRELWQRDPESLRRPTSTSSGALSPRVARNIAPLDG